MNIRHRNGNGYPDGNPASFFDRIARRYDREFARDARATERELAEVLRRLASGRTSDEPKETPALRSNGHAGAAGASTPRCPVVLDLGCGTGRAWRQLTEAGARVIGLDISNAMLAEANRRASSSSVVKLRADLYGRWPLRDSTLDAIVMLHSVLAHPPRESIEKALAHVGREINRSLRVDGFALLDLTSPAWARANLTSLGEDWYLHRDPIAGEIAAWAPAPARVVAALGLPCAWLQAPWVEPSIARVMLTRRSSPW